MKVKRLAVCHPKDGGTVYTRSLALSDDGRLIVSGLCSECHNTVAIPISLVSLENDCPRPQDDMEDAIRSHGMGIIYPMVALLTPANST